MYICIIEKLLLLAGPQPLEILPPAYRLPIHPLSAMRALADLAWQGGR